MFGRRFNIMTIAGFKIGIDLSWFFIAILLTWTLAIGYFPIEFPRLSEETYWLMGFIGMIGLFISVLLHEMGHAIVARHYDLPIEQITLFIFGGVAEMKSEPASAKEEFFVAIAGPIVSVLIAVCMYFITMLGQQQNWPLLVTGVTGYLAFINAAVVVFNLIPAFPLDGGRVFRSLVWWSTNSLNYATQIATRLGKGFGFGFILFGVLMVVFGNIIAGMWWMLIGFFLRQASISSREQFFVKSELQGEKVEAFMTKDPLSVLPTLTIQEFVNQYVYHSHHYLYPVVDNGKLLGYISLKEVKQQMPSEWPKHTVEQIMVPLSKFKTVSHDTSAYDALELIQKTDIPTLLVVNNEHLVGILSAQDLFKVISLKLELEDRAR